MHGLVNEWVLDRWGQYPTDAVIAPVGATGDEVKRVLRGGPQGIKWSDSVGYNKSPQISTRSAYRGSAKPDSSYDGNTNGYGIRLSCPASLPEWMRK
jgi:formylglycine-generating enzyme required for sulfatase activity